ncbi:hypothetical protein CBM2609_B110339 [Cupriavidus taiwanensis]|nr:hypothetical protein CBM2604_B120339 [Cupriavidus taiwanensis]SOZ30621.1 hypothetical protein CBM2609_B110339 [Cupriavidus taiwanensis]SOZ49893.1 hypothetical protein CBM2610_B90342 [Cupriavidus taiwanensis]
MGAVSSDCVGPFRYTIFQSCCAPSDFSSGLTRIPGRCNVSASRTFIGIFSVIQCFAMVHRFVHTLPMVVPVCRLYTDAFA